MSWNHRHRLRLSFLLLSCYLKPRLSSLFWANQPFKVSTCPLTCKKKGLQVRQIASRRREKNVQNLQKRKKKPQTNWAHEVSAYTTEWSVRTRLVFHSHPCRIMWVKASENGKWMNAAYAFVCCQDSYLHGSVRHIQRTKCSQVTFVSCCGVRLSRMFSICRGGREMNGILCFVL